MSIQSMPEACLWRQVAVATIPILGPCAGIQTLSGLLKQAQDNSGSTEISILKVSRQYNLCISINTLTYGVATLGLSYASGNMLLAGFGVVQLAVGGDQLIWMNKFGELIGLLNSSRRN